MEMIGNFPSTHEVLNRDDDNVLPTKSVQLIVLTLKDDLECAVSFSMLVELYCAKILSFLKECLKSFLKGLISNVILLEGLRVKLHLIRIR